MLEIADFNKRLAMEHGILRQELEKIIQILCMDQKMQNEKQLLN